MPVTGTAPTTRPRLPTNKNYCPGLEELLSYPLSEANEWIEKTNMNNLKVVLKNAIEEIHRHRQESEDSEQLSVQIQNMAPKRETIESVAKEIASLKSEMGALRQTLSEYSSHHKTSFADATRRSLFNQPLYVSVREAREESKRQEFVAKENEERKAKEQNVCIRGLAESDDDNALVKEICDDLGVSPRLVETRWIDIKRKDKDDAVFHSGPRHLIVKLETVKNKLEILRSASKLRSSEKFRNVYINRDLTALEAKELFEMRKECKARNEKISSDDDKWIIFRGSLSQRSRLPALRR